MPRDRTEETIPFSYRPLSAHRELGGEEIKRDQDKRTADHERQVRRRHLLALRAKLQIGDVPRRPAEPVPDEREDRRPDARPERREEREAHERIFSVLSMLCVFVTVKTNGSPDSRLLQN